MAIYHCSAKTIKRSAGRSSTAASAYRAGAEICDERTGEVHDYTRKSGVRESFVLAPANAPAHFQDRAQLWNAVEQIERRKDAQVAREVVVALPYELNADQQHQLVTDFTQHFVGQGMIADVAIHEPGREGDQRNVHAHIMLTMREVSGEGFGKKNRAWNSKYMLQGMREKWAELQNSALEQVCSERVDHRSYQERGIDRHPTPHLGPSACAMERRGEQSERGNEKRRIEQLNKQLEELRQQQIVQLKELAELVRQREQQNSPDFLREQLRQARQEVAQREQLNRDLSDLQNLSFRTFKKEFIEEKTEHLDDALRDKTSELRDAQYAHRESQKKYEQLGFFKRQLPCKERRWFAQCADNVERLEREVKTLKKDLVNETRKVERSAEKYAEKEMQKVVEQRKEIRENLKTLSNKSDVEELQNRLNEIEPQTKKHELEKRENEMEIEMEMRYPGM